MVTNSSSHAYALIEIGGLSIGVEANYVTGALRRPLQVTPLPPVNDTLLGTFSYGDQVIPLVDLRKWIGAPYHAPCEYVLVVAQNDRTIGLTVDHIYGMVALDDSDINTVRHDQSSMGFFARVARRQDTGELLNLLEPDRLIERAQAWTGAALGVTAPSAESVQDTELISVALFSLGLQELALPALMIGEVMPCPPIQELFGVGTPFAGVVKWRGNHLCVLRRSLLDDSTSTSPPLLVVLTSGGRHLGLEVDRAISITLAPRETLHFAEPSSDITVLNYGSWIRPDQTSVRLVEPSALLAWAPQLSATMLEQKKVVFNPDSYLICNEGMALPMSAVLHILPLPDDLHRTSRSGVVGNFAWQGCVLPLLEASEPLMAAHRIVVIEFSGRRFGLLVHDVQTIVTAFTSVTRHLSQNGSDSHALVMVEQKGNQASYRLLDLQVMLLRLASQPQLPQSNAAYDVP